MKPHELKALKHRVLADFNTAREAAAKPGGRDLKPVADTLSRVYQLICDVEDKRLDVVEEDA